MGTQPSSLITRSTTRKPLWELLITEIRDGISDVSVLLKTIDYGPMPPKTAKILQERIDHTIHVMNSLNNTYEIYVATEKQVPEAQTRFAEGRHHWDSFLHEVRNIINALSMGVGVANATGLNKTIRNALYDRSVEVIELMAGMTEALQIGNPNRVKYTPVDIRVKHWLATYIENFKITFDTKGKDITIEVIPTFINKPLQVEELKLKQILFNLLSNAVKYGKGNNICITVMHNSSFILLSVINKGAIPAREIKNLFKPYHQTAASYAGMGLGLYICKQLALSMKGKIDCMCHADTTYFIVKFPYTASKPTETWTTTLTTTS